MMLKVLAWVSLTAGQHWIRLPHSYWPTINPRAGFDFLMFFSARRRLQFSFCFVGD